MTEELPVRFFEFGVDDFPVVMTFYDAETGAELDSTTIDGPGAMRVRQRERPTVVKVRFATGEEFITNG